MAHALTATCKQQPASSPAPARPSAAVYRRRRLGALATLAILAWGVAGAGSGLVGRVTGGDGGLAPVGASGDPVPYVVQPGDTWWTIAERIAPDADPRPLVDRLVESNGATLQPGQLVLLPS